MNPVLLSTLALYKECSFTISDVQEEKESSEYQACTFNLNGKIVKYRVAKITPKKIGQFVTFWKRSPEGPIQPFDKSDRITLFVVEVSNGNLHGQFVFPEQEFYRQGIISGEKSVGKRALRVYPPWDKAENRQAIKTQQWQLKYFIDASEYGNLEKVKNLYLQL